MDNATFENTTSSGSSAENTIHFAAAAAIDYTVAALPPLVKSDQNENTSRVLSYLDVQPLPESRRPKTLQELMKPSAFERPYDICENLTDQCVFANPPAVSAWSKTLKNPETQTGQGKRNPALSQFDETL